MDTDDLSTETYNAVILTSEKFNINFKSTTFGGGYV